MASKERDASQSSGLQIEMQYFIVILNWAQFFSILIFSADNILVLVSIINNE